MAIVDPQFLVAVTGVLHFLEGSPKYLTVADLEKAQGLPKKIARAIRAYLAGEKLDLKLESTDFAFKRVAKYLTEHQPDDVQAMQALLEGLPNSAEMVGGYVGALQRVVDYAHQALPRHATPRLAGVKGIEPAPMELHRFKRKLAVCEEPLVVLQALGEKRLTSAMVECLKAIYPAIHQAMVEGIVDGVARASTKPSWVLDRARESQLNLIVGDLGTAGLQASIQGLVSSLSAGDKKAKTPSDRTSSRVAQSFGAAK